MTRIDGFEFMGFGDKRPTSRGTDIAHMIERYSKMALEKRHLFVHYGSAVVTVAITTLLRKLLTPLLGDHGIFIAYLPAVMITSWIGGLVPGLAALLLGAVAGIWFFIPPDRNVGRSCSC